jgi:hypothetical protein
VSLRRRAVAAGFRDPVPFRSVPELALLRGRADFRLLRMDLDMPSDPRLRVESGPGPYA